MAYYDRQGYMEEDKICYSEQAGYAARPAYSRPHHMGMGGGYNVNECQSYSSGGYGQGSFLAPAPVPYHGGACIERKEEICVSTNGGHKMRPAFGHRRRRVMRHSESRGSYSCSESDSD